MNRRGFLSFLGVAPVAAVVAVKALDLRERRIVGIQTMGNGSAASTVHPMTSAGGAHTHTLTTVGHRQPFDYDGVGKWS